MLSRVSFLLVFIVLAAKITLILLRQTYIYHVYNINIYISFDYFKSFNTCTYIYTLAILLYYALYHIMTHKSTQTSRRNKYLFIYKIFQQ